MIPVLYMYELDLYVLASLFNHIQYCRSSGIKGPGGSAIYLHEHEHPCKTDRQDAATSGGTAFGRPVWWNCEHNAPPPSGQYQG